MENKLITNYREGHIALWTWLSEHPDGDKEDYFKTQGILIGIKWDGGCDVIKNNCYACEENKNKSFLGMYDSACIHCPLKWTHKIYKTEKEFHTDENNYMCESKDSPYNKWNIKQSRLRGLIAWNREEDIEIIEKLKKEISKLTLEIANLEWEEK